MAKSETRLKLWEIVHDQCVPGQEEDGQPSPCVAVEQDYAVLPDRNGVAQFLLIPTRRISGIESSDILDPALPDYWDAAWATRHFMFDKLHKELPREDIGLAINSQPSRSQDQLHIHIDCLAPAVSAQLREHASAVGDEWKLLDFELAGRRYLARRVTGDDLSQKSPFQSLKEIPGAIADQGAQTLVVAGATFDGQNGFIILEDHADPANGGKGHGEDLLDLSCAIAALSPSKSIR